MTLCELWDAQSPAHHPHRRVLRFRCTLGESARRGKRERRFGDRFTTTASAEVVGSWIRRLSHHRMTPCELCDAQTPARRPHRRVWSLGCELELHVRRGGRDRARGSAVTVTTSAEAVDSSTGRLSHHLMMSGNVCDGIELVRRPNNGRLSWISRFRASRGGPWLRGVNGVVHSSFSSVLSV